jgi:hypothetical protein
MIKMFNIKQEEEQVACEEWQMCDFYGTGACVDIACDADNFEDKCSTLYCNDDNVCASCNGIDDNCPDDYECGVSVCKLSEGLTTGALWAIIISSVVGVILIAGLVVYCMKKSKGDNARDSVMQEALTQNDILGNSD